MRQISVKVTTYVFYQINGKTGLSYKLGRRIEWDVASGKITGKPEKILIRLAGQSGKTCFGLTLQ